MRLLRRRHAGAVAAIVAGTLLGAGVVASGRDPERELALELRELQLLAGTVPLSAPVREEIPRPGARLPDPVLLHVADLLQGVPQHEYPRTRLRKIRSKKGSKKKSRKGCEPDELLFASLSEEARDPYRTPLDELVRNLVRPESWGRDSKISAVGWSLLIQNRHPVVSDVRRFLDRLRAGAHRTIRVEAQLIELPDSLGARLAAGDAKEMAEAEERDLLAALGAGDARRLFAGALIALAGQRALLWHGTQRALLVDAEVEVRRDSRASDPEIYTEQLGGMLHVRAVGDGGGGRVRLELVFEDDRAVQGDVRVRPTKDAHGLQMPAQDVFQSRTQIDVRNGAWSVAASVSGKDGRRRVLLVRPTILDRGGGR